MASIDDRRQPSVSSGNDGGTGEPQGTAKCGWEPQPTSGREAARSAGWALLSLLGVFACCGGPVLASWIAASGIAAALGAWWAHGGIWWAAAIGLAGLGGSSLWVMRRRQRL